MCFQDTIGTFSDRPARSPINMPPAGTLPLLFAATLLWLGSYLPDGAQAQSGEEKSTSPQQEASLRKLVDDLCHKSWKRREKAQKEIIAAG